jgi:uncharacterized membrane protein
MRVLLFNDNPVVTKLVTLSAQKTGDQLEVCSNIEVLNPGEYDLLIVDDGLYNDESAAILGTSISASQHLFMANRDSEVPDGFEHRINKPFLPTDLVELFSTMSTSTTENSGHSDDTLESFDTLDEETFDLDGLDDDLILDEEKDDDLDDFEGLELDTLEADADEEMLLNFDLGEDLEDEQDSPDLLMDESDEESEGILDKEDLAEVQSLLDDTEDTLDDEIETGSLDDEDLLGLELDIHDSDDLEEDVSDNAAEEILGDLNLEDTLLDEDDDTDVLESDDFDSDDVSDEDALDALDEKLEAEMPSEPDEDEFDLDALLESDLEALSDEESDTTEDDEVLSGFEDEIETAMSELSDEELDESVDEETLLDIVNNAEVFEEFSGLDDLDEQSLKAAVGELDIADLEALKSDEEAEEFSDEPIVQPVVKNDKLEGVDALKALLSGLESEDVVKSLKGMNISINISFGDDT